MQQQRVRRSESDWRKVLSDFKSSGLSGIAFCRKHHIGPKGFYRARSLYRRGGKGGQFVQAVADPVTKPALSVIEIILPHGRVRIDGRVSPTWVADLLKSLAA
ncbi:MAG: hypothetical protein WBM41_12170 [Arenicellales bacterium]|jgi:hypothetical protein